MAQRTDSFIKTCLHCIEGMILWYLLVFNTRSASGIRAKVVSLQMNKTSLNHYHEEKKILYRVDRMSE